MENRYKRNKKYLKVFALGTCVCVFITSFTSLRDRTKLYVHCENFHQRLHLTLLSLPSLTHKCLHVCCLNHYKEISSSKSLSYPAPQPKCFFSQRSERATWGQVASNHGLTSDLIISRQPPSSNTGHATVGRVAGVCVSPPAPRPVWSCCSSRQGLWVPLPLGATVKQKQEIRGFKVAKPNTGFWRWTFLVSVPPVCLMSMSPGVRFHWPEQTMTSLGRTYYLSGRLLHLKEKFIPFFFYLEHFMKECGKKSEDVISGWWHSHLYFFNNIRKCLTIWVLFVPPLYSSYEEKRHQKKGILHLPSSFFIMNGFMTE